MNESIDGANARFWNELCGTGLAAAAGIASRSPADLVRFDAEYLAFYPYLQKYVFEHRVADALVLEIGLGYGTLGQQIAAAGARYYGLDLAEGPVAMMHDRLEATGCAPNAIRGNASGLPLASNAFDLVVSIGALHHTGHLEECIAEIHRVLKPCGVAVVMLYNQFAYRQWCRWPLRTLMALVHERASAPADQAATERQRRMYDTNRDGAAAPATVLVSERRVRDLFRAFCAVDIQKENCDDVIPYGRLLSLRRRLLGPLGRRAGLDLYVTAKK